MAEWVPPKIDYWDTPRPVSGEDFKRIEKNTAYLKERVDALESRGYAIRIAANTSLAEYHEYISVQSRFKWRSAFAVGKQVFFEVNMCASSDHLSGEKVYARLYNYTTESAIVSVSTSEKSVNTIVTSPPITIPDGAVVGVQIHRGARGAVYLHGAWLVIL